MGSQKFFQKLNEEIIKCQKCSRLVNYRNEVAKNPPKRYRGQNYWAKPVPGFGDENAKLLIIGLAPAANGANRTGRMFTGDRSGEWLYRGLYQVGLSNKEVSLDASDDLKLKNVYVTAPLRCAPPKNKPTNQELINCRDYISSEFSYFNSRDLRAILALGQIAFKVSLELLNCHDKLQFKHGQSYEINNMNLICSYHPSQQNTFTGKLTWEMFISVLKKAKELARI